MRSLIVAIVLMSSSAFAMDNNCDVNIDGDFRFENKVLTVILDDNTQMKIDEFHTLTVNDKPIKVDAQQRAWLQDYYQGIEYSAPKVAALASEGVKLANTTIHQVFTELLGSDSQAVDKLTKQLNQLDQKVQRSFYAEDGSLRIHSQSFENGDFLGKDWEKHFESSIEQIMAESIGSLMVALGSEILFSGGDMNEFEKKMNRFGEQLEQKIESQVAALELKAEDLCHALKGVDQAENNLQQNLKLLAKLDVLNVDSRHNAM